MQLNRSKIVIPLGATGSGKSSLGCYMTNNADAFVRSSSIISCTDKIRSRVGPLFGQQSQKCSVKFYDTPGIIDSEGRDAQFADEIVEKVRKVRTVHCFLLVFNG